MQVAVQSYRFSSFIQAKLNDYAQLVKLRLNLTVVFSSVFGYLFAAGLGSFSWSAMSLLALSGFAITAAANAINQILEKDYDRQMTRTAGRPLAAGRMSLMEACLIVGTHAILGLLILAYGFNTLAALLGCLALISYGFVYTPLKRISPISVFVGAIPGALPPVIGWVAFTGTLGLEAYLLFSIQFLWQFPHFWAIGWLAYDDYKKAGFKLLTTSVDGRNRATAINILIYMLALIVVGLVPTWLGLVSFWGCGLVLLAGLLFVLTGIRLLVRIDRASALMVMLASILYLPIVQIVMLIFKM